MIGIARHQIVRLCCRHAVAKEADIVARPSGGQSHQNRVPHWLHVRRRRVEGALLDGSRQGV